MPSPEYRLTDAAERFVCQVLSTYGAARRLNKLRRYSLRRSVVLRSLASAGSMRVGPARRSVPDLRSARRRSAPDRRSVVLRSIVPGHYLPPSLPTP